MPEPEKGRNAEKEGNARGGVPEKETGIRKETGIWECAEIIVYLRVGPRREGQKTF